MSQQARRRHVGAVTILACVGIMLAGGPRVAAEEKSAITVKTKDGLRFSVPPDWPIEKRDGVVAPIPMEEYLSRKFTSLENRVRTLEGQVGSLDLRVRLLEEQLKKQQRLQSGEAGTSAP